MNPSDLTVGRRAQPPRQTRNQPPRSSVPGSRAFGSRASIDEPTEIDVCPAITHFADAITALPKELVRHFTLLKEVDAKIFAPEDDLGKLIDAALNLSTLPERRQALEAHHNLGATSAPMSAQGSANGSMINGQVGSFTSVPEDVSIPVNPYDSSNTIRRHLMQHCAYTMQNMLVSLDEKNHVISTAAEALGKQLARIDDCFPYIELEVSEEARYGSLTHWAYPENRATKHASSGGSRRELAAANTLSAAAAHLVEEAAARSDARKQALLAKRSSKHQTESDFDDSHDRHKESSKKLHGNSKVRKAVDASLSVGLGITNGGGTNGNPPKRRKVEKGPTGGAIMDRALSSVFGSNGTATKGKGGSPRETPGPDGSKKRSRAAASTNGQTGRKRYVIVGICLVRILTLCNQEQYSNIRCDVSFHCILPYSNYLPRTEAPRTSVSCTYKWWTASLVSCKAELHPISGRACETVVSQSEWSEHTRSPTSCRSDRTHNERSQINDEGNSNKLDRASARRCE